MESQAKELRVQVYKTDRAYWLMGDLCGFAVSRQSYPVVTEYSGTRAYLLADITRRDRSLVGATITEAREIADFAVRMLPLARHEYARRVVLITE